MNTIRAAIVLIIIGYVSSSMCMEVQIINRNPRRIEHLLQNNGQWLEQLMVVEAQGKYCQNLCIARQALQGVLSGKNIDKSDTTNFRGMYSNDEKWLSNQFGVKAAQLAITTVQQMEIAEMVRGQMRNESDWAVDRLDDYIKEQLTAQRIFTQLNLSTHFSGKNGKTLLHCAASQSHLNKILKTMLTHCNKPDVVDAYDRSPLFYAVKKGALDNIDTLRKFGANHFLQDCNKSIPLHIAAQYSRHEYIKKLNSHGLWSDAQNYCGDTPLHVALKNNADSKTILILLKDCAISCGVLNYSGQSPIDVAMEYKQEKSEKLMRQGVLHAILFRLLKPSFNEKLVANACEQIEKLYRCGADINARNKKGQTLLHCKCLDTDTIVFLIKNGAKVNNRDNNGRTPLDVAVDFWSSNSVVLLLQAGAVVTPAMYNVLRCCGSASKDKWRVFSLVIDAYKNQNCSICYRTHQELDERKITLSYIPCKNNHRSDFICYECYQELPSVNGTKPCLYHCPEGLEAYNDMQLIQ